MKPFQIIMPFLIAGAIIAIVGISISTIARGDEAPIAPFIEAPKTPYLSVADYNTLFCVTQSAVINAQLARPMGATVQSITPLDPTDPDTQFWIRERLGVVLDSRKIQIVGTPDEFLYCPE